MDTGTPPADESAPSTSSAQCVGIQPDPHGPPCLQPLPCQTGPMDAQRPQFDSHRFVKRLTLAGLSEEVAEILADEHTNLIVPQDVATQGDVAVVKTDVAVVKTDVAAVKANVAAVKTDVAAVKTDVAAVKTDVAAVKTDVAAVKTDVAAVKANVAAVKANVAAVKTDVAAVKTDVAAVKAHVAAVETRVAAVETHVAAVDSKVDALATDLDTVKSRMATKEELHREIAASEQRLRNAILEVKVSLIKWMFTSMMVFSGIVIAAMTALR